MTAIRFLATVKTAHLRAVADWLESHPAAEHDPDRAERIDRYRAEADRREAEERVSACSFCGAPDGEHRTVYDLPCPRAAEGAA